MNKETRLFIYGFFLLLLGSFASALQIFKLINGTFEGGWYWLLLVLNLSVFISGYIKVNKSIEKE